MFITIKGEFKLFKIYCNAVPVVSSRGNHMLFESFLEAQEYMKPLCGGEAIRVNNMLPNVPMILDSKTIVEIREV